MPGRTLIIASLLQFLHSSCMWICLLVSFAWPGKLAVGGLQNLLWPLVPPGTGGPTEINLFG